MIQAFAPRIPFADRQWLLWERTLYGAAQGQRGRIVLVVGVLLVLLLISPLLPLLLILAVRAPIGPKGAHAVGVRDVEHSISVDGDNYCVRVRIFYPATSSPKANSAQLLLQWLRGIGQWLPAGPTSPVHARYARAHALALPFLPQWLKPYMASFSFLLRVARLPTAVERDAPAAGAKGTPPAAWPLALFSHGLCGTSAGYSSLCAELASQGSVVLAVEHKDGSAIYSETSDGHAVPYAGGVGEAVTAKQLERRTRELVAIAHGAVEIASAALGDDGLTIDGACVTLAGHSFGGAAALRAAASMTAVGGGGDAMPVRDVRSVLAVDPWLPGGVRGVFSGAGDGRPAAVPTLAVLTQSMMYEPNGEEIGAVMRSVAAHGAPALYVEAKDTRHQEASDFVAIAYRTMRLFCMAGRLPPKHSFGLHAQLVGGFEGALGLGLAGTLMPSSRRIAEELSNGAALGKIDPTSMSGGYLGDAYVVHGAALPAGTRWERSCKEMLRAGA